VDGDGEVEGGGFFHAGSEGGGTGVNEFVETGGAHEGFEADGTAVGEGFEVVERVGSEAAPESEVGAGFLFGEGAFGFEGFDVEDGRGGV
jgi:hypothetical protein